MKGLTSIELAALEFITSDYNPDKYFTDYFNIDVGEYLEQRGLLRTIAIPEDDYPYECEGWDITPMGKLLLATYKEHNIAC